jgi:two-component system nitrate/nitrite response regulator NarL
MKLTVLIASSSEAVRRRLSRGLRKLFAIREVAEALELELKVVNDRPDIALLDLGLRKLGGVDGVAVIRRLSPPTKIILLTRTPDANEGISVLKAGAVGYCSLSIEPLLIKKAVEMVQKGEIWVGRDLIPYLVRELVFLTAGQEERAPSPVNSLNGLTFREREIAHLVASGDSNKEIGSRLNITEATVKAHLTSIFRKLGFSDRLRLAIFVAEHERAQQILELNTLSASSVAR